MLRLLLRWLMELKWEMGGAEVGEETSFGRREGAGRKSREEGSLKRIEGCEKKKRGSLKARGNSKLGQCDLVDDIIDAA